MLTTMDIERPLVLFMTLFTSRCEVTVHVYPLLVVDAVNEECLYLVYVD